LEINGRPAHRNERHLTRRDTFLWAAFIFIAHDLFDILTEIPPASVSQLITNFAAVGIFQYLAWYAIFRLLHSSNAAVPASALDVFAAVAGCFLLLLPTGRSIWIASTGMAAYWWVQSRGDLKLRAAAIILAALSIQELWGRVLFHLVAYPLLCVEAAIVGSILEIIRPGTVWQDNVITGPSGNSILLYEPCSAFHNLSLAMLCWVTLSRLRHQGGILRDFRTGLAVGLTMVSWNVARLCLMAWDLDLYHYWHDGSGTQIFELGASISILSLSLYGLKPVQAD
jgi:hypothetical protein